MDQNTEMLELLQKIEKSNRIRTILLGVICACVVVAAIGCIALCVTVSDLLPQIQQIMGQMQGVLTNLEQTSGALAELDLPSMVADIDELVLLAQDSLQATMEKLEALDIETLNQAIEDLAAVVEPLANLSNFFGK